MTNPTSNFGWQMPTPTDLVTDLPADFEVFGQAVDTSLADLQGGTTGQILAKASNSNMDFAWITNDVGDITAVNVTSPITGGGSSGAVTIGINAATTSVVGAVQLSDSTSTTSSVLASTPTATKAAYDLANTANTTANSAYAAGFTNNYFAGKNAIINGALQIWQRGTSIANTASTLYTADRWVTVGTPAAFTISRQATGDTTNLPSIQYCARIQRNSGQTNTTNFDLVQGLETSNSIPFAGKTVTLSFYARAGANYSPTSSILAAALYSGTGTDQSPTAAFTGQAAVINQNATLTTTWQRFTYTASVASTATQLKTIFTMAPTGTAGAADYFEVTGVQVEAGSVATPFQTSSGSIGGELVLCQRYAFNPLFGETSLFKPVAVGYSISTTSSRIGLTMPVTMRISPSLTVTAGDFSIGYSSGANGLLTNLTVETSSPSNTLLTGTTSGITANVGYTLYRSTAGSTNLILSAEL
jgi:hypothetical protein